MRLRPVHYHFKDSAQEAPLQLGFIAQEVREEFPTLVSEGEDLTLNYSGLSVVAIGAIKELYEVVRKQEVEIVSLRSRLTEIETQHKARVAELSAIQERGELEQKAARVDSLERDVAELKKLVAQLAEAGKAAKQTAQATPASPAFAAVASLEGASGTVGPER